MMNGMYILTIVLFALSSQVLYKIVSLERDDNGGGVIVDISLYKCQMTIFHSKLERNVTLPYLANRTCNKTGCNLTYTSILPVMCNSMTCPYNPPGLHFDFHKRFGTNYDKPLLLHQFPPPMKINGSVSGINYSCSNDINDDDDDVYSIMIHKYNSFLHNKGVMDIGSHTRLFVLGKDNISSSSYKFKLDNGYITISNVEYILRSDEAHLLKTMYYNILYDNDESVAKNKG